jgi:UDP-N-acetylglucosamine 2-epimerase (non-hydrolysing)
MTSLHFAATRSAAENLFREGVPPGAVFITGNTVIDALLQTVEGLSSGRLPGTEWPFGKSGRKLILMTTHRRESFGKTLEGIFAAVATIARRPDVEVVFPVHRNPNVSVAARRIFQDCPNVHLIESLEYPELVGLLARCDFVMTDSGGIQEEAPALGKPVLVLRETTERPEAVAAGAALLVGTEPGAIAREACRLLEDHRHYLAMAQKRSIFGDGRACEQIARILAEHEDRLSRADGVRATPKPAAQAAHAAGSLLPAAAASSRE